MFKKLASTDYQVGRLCNGRCNLEEFNKTMSGNAGSNAVGNKEADEAAGE